MSLSDSEKISCLRLMMSENIGPVTYAHLLSYYGTATEALGHINELAARGGRKKPMTLATENMAEKQIEIADKKNVKILFRQENEYPSLLRHISDAAPILFTLGNISVFAKKSIAVVGTRNASVNGKALARKIAHDLAESDYNIVSGLAHGIDRAAHMGALSSPHIPTTTAVLGTPVDEIYPIENKDIYDEIVRNGCLVSEFPFHTALTPRNFPRRNRIISGLSLGTLVIEAQEKSGSLITAREAASQGREVFAVPGSPVDPRSSGPNALIRDGAFLVTSAEDIINVLEHQPAFSLKEIEKDIQYNTVPLSENNLTDARQIVYQNLSTDPISVDDLIRETQLDVRVVNIILVELAIAGRLERYPGNRVSLIYSVE